MSSVLRNVFRLTTIITRFFSLRWSMRYCDTAIPHNLNKLTYFKSSIKPAVTLGKYSSKHCRISWQDQKVLWVLYKERSTVYVQTWENKEFEPDWIFKEFSKIRTTLLHEVFATRLFRDFATLKFPDFAKILYFEWLKFHVFDWRMNYFFGNIIKQVFESSKRILKRYTFFTPVTQHELISKTVVKADIHSLKVYTMHYSLAFRLAWKFFFGTALSGHKVFLSWLSRVTYFSRHFNFAFY